MEINPQPQRRAGGPGLAGDAGGRRESLAEEPRRNLAGGALPPADGDAGRDRDPDGTIRALAAELDLRREKLHARHEAAGHQGFRLASLLIVVGALLFVIWLMLYWLEGLPRPGRDAAPPAAAADGRPIPDTGH